MIKELALPMGRGYPRRWEDVQAELAIWQIGALPGLVVIGLVVILRAIGLLQPLEWWALDCLLQLRPDEPTDEHILIVGIDEEDIQSIRTYPVPDGKIAGLIEKLQTDQPRVIGLDIIRNLPVEPGHAQLIQVFQTDQNVIGIEKALPDATGKTVQPPPDLPPEQVGFVDLIIDAGGALRRALIGTPTETGEYKFSLPLLLAERYLSGAGLVLDNGIRDAEAMRFGNTEFVRFRSNSGGYVNADARGNQFLINYRSGKTPFHKVSLTDVMQGKVPSSWIRDRIVLIGMTATSVGDLKQTNAVDNSISGSIYGVEAHAHITSQMLSSVLQGRPWLQTWADQWEYLWILGWGILGISWGRFFASPIRILSGVGLSSVFLVGMSYGALMAGWWLAVIPSLVALMLNSIGLSAFYRYQQDLQTRLRERELVIEKTYTAIHNNPVQTLKSILSKVRQGEIAPKEFCCDLERLETELRAIEELVRQESVTQSTNLYLCEGKRLNLEHPMEQLLYEVYWTTLHRVRDFPCFAAIVKIPAFEKLQRHLTMQQKQELCRFMEESLCNAGKYAEGMTRLEVSCGTEKGWSFIRIADNGVGIHAVSITNDGYGTRHAKKVARQLGGTFRRIPNSPKGTICELRYPITPSWFCWFWKF